MDGPGGPAGAHAIRLTPLHVAGLALLALVAGLVGGVAGAWIAGDAGTPAAPATVAAPASTSDPAEALRQSLTRAVEAVVTVVVDPLGGDNEGTAQRGGLNYGTGFVISEEGLVLTARHVIEGAESIRVVLASGEEREATIIADDAPFQDAVILQTDGRGLRVARLGQSSTARQGDPVAVISTGVYTYDNQVKQGIISGLDLTFPRTGVTYTGMLQTDAAVNNGDSGSPLVNSAGEVIGLVTSIVRQNPAGDQVEGVAYAHAIDDLRLFIDAVAATGVNPRPRLGIERLGEQHLSLDPAVAAELGVPVTSGAAIIRVAPGSPAEQAGIAPGDVVLAVEGVAIEDNLPFVNLLGAAPTGAPLRLTVLRGGATADILVEPRPIVSAGARVGG